MCYTLPLKTNIQKSARAAISTFPIDPDGNLLTDGRFDYTWNAENRLITITTKTTEDTKKKKLEFVYDHMGRRTIKKVYSWTGADWQLDKTITFVYNGYNEVARFIDSTLAKTYIWGEDLSGSLQGAGGVGGLLVVADITGSYLPQFGANGNVTGYVDASTGAQVADYSYSPFGRTITKSGSKADEFDYRFNTKPQDEETGLYYYIYRFYDPELGRWASRDPRGEFVRNRRLGDRSFNLIYGYTMNSSMSYVDYLGLVTYDSSFSPTELVILKAEYARMKNTLDLLWKEVEKAYEEQKFANNTFNVLTTAWGNAGRGRPVWNRLKVRNLRAKLKLLKEVTDKDNLKIKCGNKTVCKTLSVEGAYTPQECDGIYICPNFFTNRAIVREQYAVLGHELSHYATAHEIGDHHLRRPNKYLKDAHMYHSLFRNNDTGSVLSEDDLNDAAVEEFGEEFGEELGDALGTL